MHHPPLSSRSAAPSSIALPAAPVFSSFVLRGPSAALDSPALSFHTPTDSPYFDFPSPPVQFFTPPTSPQHDVGVSQAQVNRYSDPPPSPPPICMPHASQRPAVDHPDPDPPNLPTTDDAFPAVIDLAIDLALDDEGLSTLEKTYLYSRSRAAFHRVFIAHALPSYLHQVTPQEAFEYVLPLLSGLAMDEEESVKEALAAELVPVIWWFFTHCQIIPDELGTEEAYASSSTTVTISVQAFTPILGTLLLSSNPLVGGAARFAVVDLLSRMRKADARENGMYPNTGAADSNSGDDLDDGVEDQSALITGLFKIRERDMFRQEILHQVVIGMGRLDMDMDVNEYDNLISHDKTAWGPNQPQSGQVIIMTSDKHEYEQIIPEPHGVQVKKEAPHTSSDDVNPYFPTLPANYSSSSPSSTESTPSPSDSLRSSSSSPVSPSGPAVASPNSFEFRPHHAARASPQSPSLESAPAPVRSGYSPISSLNHGLSQAPSSPPLSGLPNNSTSIWSSARYGDPSKLANAFTAAQNRQGSNEASMAPSSTVAAPLSPTERPRREEHAPPTASQSEPLEPDYGDIYGSDESEEEQAAIGRLSSMSLMAAVTATGSLAEDTQRAFVREVERVGRDATYFYVRREASLALGALAKVVPEEVVVCSLLPLFDTLRWDPDWRVRHSALFALPAILPRLSPNQRRTVALETLVALSSDVYAAVRSGVLEALGEVLYAFHGDQDGPPTELIRLFLGREGDRHVREGQQEANPQTNGEPDPLECFFTDPDRPLICAFNFPAVALTLGPSRWSDLRETYLDIARNRSSKVRRTLAASLGQLAKIIGSEASRRDLVDVWWDAMHSEEEDVRSKAVESLGVFLGVIGNDIAKTILQGLLTSWEAGVFRGWRERESIIRSLEKFFALGGSDIPFVIKGLLFKGLQDSVAAVRETSISILPRMMDLFSSETEVRDDLNSELEQLSRSSLFRRRMAFVACQQARALYAPESSQWSGTSRDVNLLKSVVDLADDAVEDVRIGIARLLSVLYVKFVRESHPLPAILVSLIQRLAVDPSHEVKSYLPDMHQDGFIFDSDTAGQLSTTNHSFHRNFPHPKTFSRPPLYHTSHSSQTNSGTVHNGAEATALIITNSDGELIGQAALGRHASELKPAASLNTVNTVDKHEVPTMSWMVHDKAGDDRIMVSG